VRADRQITQEDLAFDAAVDRTTISGIENGSYNPSIDLLEKIAAALSVDIAVLFEPLRDDRKPAALPAGRKSRRR
jgi:DNA-binding XRE family transcriptional regulator